MGIAVGLAFLMTLITAGSNVALKKGFNKIDPFLASFFSIVSGAVLLWIIVFLFGPKSSLWNIKGIMVFVVVGSFAPIFARTFTYYGIHTLGAGRAAPLRALTPFFATIMAIVFLKETPKAWIFLGISLIFLGIVMVSSERDSKSDYRPIHILYPLAAAFLAGVAANLRKYGLNIMPHPVYASAIAATSSSFFLILYLIIRRKRFCANIAGFTAHKKELFYVIIASCLTSLGDVIDLSALLFGKVSLVVPIFAITPFVIIVMSKIFLSKQEKVTMRLFLSTILIVCGIFITIASA